jgi:hypothetical protein
MIGYKPRHAAQDEEPPDTMGWWDDEAPTAPIPTVQVQAPIQSMAWYPPPATRPDQHATLAKVLIGVALTVLGLVTGIVLISIVALATDPNHGGELPQTPVVIHTTGDVQVQTTDNTLPQVQKENQP